MRLRLARRIWSGASFGDTPVVWNDNRSRDDEPIWKSFSLLWFGSVFFTFVPRGVSVPVALCKRASFGAMAYIQLLSLYDRLSGNAHFTPARTVMFRVA